MKSSIIGAALVASLASAAPTPVPAQTNIDGVILNYALTLEHLEAAFYQLGVTKFTAADFAKAGFTDSLFYKNLEEVARDEQVHVSFLTEGLKAAGVASVAPCTYDFGDLTPETFLQTAQVLEGVGVSAYLGAAQNITAKAYLTAAASILTVEARHSAFIRGSLKMSPAPQPFDIPLDFDQVYSLAVPFIKSCPSSNPPLPVKAFPTLSLAPSTKMPVHQSDEVEFVLAAGCSIPSGPLYVAFPLATGTMFSGVVPKDGKIMVKIPQGTSGPAGQVYAILTNSSTSVTDENTIAGPAVVEILPPYLS